VIALGLVEQATREIGQRLVEPGRDADHHPSKARRHEGTSGRLFSPAESRASAARSAR
jgi:hypothetical protein